MPKFDWVGLLIFPSAYFPTLNMAQTSVATSLPSVPVRG